jgi:aspartate/glutamate racemase
VVSSTATAATDRAARAQVTACGNALADGGAQSLVLACTELSVLFASGAAPEWLVPAYDAAQVVAERVV